MAQDGKNGGGTTKRVVHSFSNVHLPFVPDGLGRTNSRTSWEQMEHNYQLVLRALGLESMLARPSRVKDKRDFYYDESGNMIIM